MTMTDLPPTAIHRGEEELRVGVLGSREDNFGWPLLDGVTRVHHDDPVRHARQIAT